MESREGFVEIGNPIKHIASATPGEGRTIKVVWTTGERALVDLAPLIFNRRVFARLQEDDEFFRSMKVEPAGRSIFWLGEPDCEIPAAYLDDHAVSF